MAASRLARPTVLMVPDAQWPPTPVTVRTPAAASNFRPKFSPKFSPSFSNPGATLPAAPAKAYDAPTLFAQLQETSMQQNLTRFLKVGAVAVLMAAAHPALWAKCQPNCAVASSVVHAAGVPPGLRLALQRLQFSGSGLAAGDGAVVKDIVRTLSGLPAGSQVSLSTRADAGITGVAGARQAQARAQALEQALRAALKAAGVKDTVLKSVVAAK